MPSQHHWGLLRDSILSKSVKCSHKLPRESSADPMLFLHVDTISVQEHFAPLGQGTVLAT